MLLSDFDYILPDQRIAKFPPKVRGTTRLLVLNRQTNQLTDSAYSKLDTFLHSGDLVILNDTKVMHSRLFCTLPDGRQRELIVLEHHQTSTNPNSNLDPNSRSEFEPDTNRNSDLRAKVNLARVLYRGKLHPHDTLILQDARPLKTPTKSAKAAAATNPPKGQLPQLEVTQILGNGIAEVAAELPFDQLTEQFGTVPLPPYLHRAATDADLERYQTVWAKQAGSAAAPTASLNMTADLLQRLQAQGVQIAYLTLHVGLGTFLPIRTDRVEDHQMHSEWYSIPDSTLTAINATKQAGHRVIAIGTTVARTLEFYARTQQASGEDDIFIYPGFQFQLVDGLLTNFHAPKSTVLMLAAAFAGPDRLKTAYAHALAQEYNFLSYGDSMLIL